MYIRCFANRFKIQTIRLLSASNRCYMYRSIYSTNEASRKSLYKIKDAKKMRSFVLSKYVEYLKGYDAVLEKKFPGAMRVYRVFMEGIRDFYKDLKLFIKIVRLLNTPGQTMKNLKLEEIELYHQMPKDMMRVAPVLLVSALPLANYIVFPLAYYFPRQLLCRHFWNLQQKSEFNVIFLHKRLIHNKPVFRHLQTQLKNLKGNCYHKRWSNVLGKIGSGVQPTADEILECKELFANGPYQLLYISGNHVKHLAKMHEIRPGLFKRSKLHDKALIIKAMDEAIVRAGGVRNLQTDALRNACLIRGLNPTNMSTEYMTSWISQWILISREINKDNLSLLLHCPILLGYNQPSNWRLVYSYKNK